MARTGAVSATNLGPDRRTSASPPLPFLVRNLVPAPAMCSGRSRFRDRSRRNPGPLAHVPRSIPTISRRGPVRIRGAINAYRRDQHLVDRRLARGCGGEWMIVFDGFAVIGQRGRARQSLLCRCALHRGADGADDRIVELVAALPEGRIVLVHTSESPVAGARVGARRRGGGRRRPPNLLPNPGPFRSPRERGTDTIGPRPRLW